MKDLRLIQVRFPFLTLFAYSNEEYIGIIQNQSKNIVSVYVLNYLLDVNLKKQLIELGDIWWSESNRKIPINLFLKNDFTMFDSCLKNYITKEFRIIQGPTVSLQNLAEKRVKRKKIELIRDNSF